jgi:uncharacterized protein YcbK (DUF882 family)
VHVGNARLNPRRLSAARAGYSCGLALLLFLFGSRALQNAVAEGDTRTITMHHIHTDEDITITYKRDGRYDDAALDKLNWFLRDWRRGEQTRMDPRLIDLVWEVQREAGSNEPVQVVCGYRSPQTNEMLRHHSKSSGVARYSQHMLGRAMDFYIPGVPLEQIREDGLRLQRGGVGFYPESGSPFVHMDVGGIRMWPRMTHDQLVRVFPDGRTVHIPTDGKPLSGYALALAEIAKRGALPSESSIAAARNAGVNVDAVLASNGTPANLLTNANDDESEDAAPAPAKSVRAEVKAAAVAATRSVEKKLAAAGAAVATASTKVAAAATAKLKLVHVAALLPSASAAPATPAAPTGRDNAAATAVPTSGGVIVDRGYWQGPADGTVVANPAGARPIERAASLPGADSTGSIGPFATPDGAAPKLTLAYAEQPNASASAAPTGIDALRAAAAPAEQAAPQPVSNGTTFTVKRIASQVASALVMASASSVTVIKAGAHLDNPWLRAIVLSPSVHRFLTTVALGERDFRSLAALMVKPHNAVMMTFAADPNPGLDYEHFSGAAIVFVSTVTYPTRTASLDLKN